MSKRLVASLGVACAGLTLAGGALLSQVAPASASTVTAHNAPAQVRQVTASTQGSPQLNKSQCTGSNRPHSLCLWRDTGYAGTIWSFSTSTFGENSYHFVGTNRNDQASSFYNHRAAPTLVFKDFTPNNPNSGLRWCIPSGSGLSNLTLHQWANHTSLNDSISAFNLTSGSC